MVHLIPTYREKLKSAKPVLRTVKRWTNEAEQDLKACFDLTDWTVFEAAATELDELTETVTSYISFCEDMCIPTWTHLTYNNDKPWFTAKLRQLRQAKEDAHRKGDKVLYKQAKYTLEKEIRVAKRNYSGKLRNKLSSSDSASVWKCMKDITSYKTPSPSTVETQIMADDLNEFYCRFEKTPFTLQIREDDVSQVFEKKESTRPRPVLTSWPPSSHRSSTDHWRETLGACGRGFRPLRTTSPHHRPVTALSPC